MTSKESINTIIEQILKDDRVSLSLQGFEYSETSTTASISIDFLYNGKPCMATGKGVGLIDASFNCLRDFFSADFYSLKQIKFQELYIKPNFLKTRKKSRSEAPVEVCIEFSNKNEERILFEHFSKSVSFSSVECIIGAIEFYINCEKLFYTLKRLVKEAASRDRNDIKERYLYHISEVVKVAYYGSKH